MSRYRQLLRGVVTSRSSVDFALKVLPILAKLGWTLPAAYLIWWTIKPLTPRGSPYRVLVIEKAVFTLDALAVLSDMPEVHAFGVKRAVIKALALGVLPRAVCDDATYVSSDSEAEAAKQRYRQLWGSVWRHLRRLGGYDAVLTGNWCYWAEREMAAAMEEQGAPFLVLHKEGIKPPARSDMLCNLFRATRGRFTGRRIFVYQELERNHQLRSETAQEDQIRIVGMPRLDCVHTWRRRAAAGEVLARAEKPTVLFLAFLANNFLPSYSGVVSDLAWIELVRGSYAAMVRLACAHPEIDVVIRPRLDEVSRVEMLLSMAGVRPINIRIIAEGDVMPLIEAAWVICGHNTTVLLEGIAAGKPVVQPHFAEALDPRYGGYILDLGEAVEYARSPDSLVERLATHCASSVSIPVEITGPARVALARWAGNADGRAAARARAGLFAELTAGSRSAGDPA